MAPDPQQNGSVEKNTQLPPNKENKKSKKDEKKDEDLVSEYSYYSKIWSIASFPFPCILSPYVFLLLLIWKWTNDILQSEEDLALKQQLELYVERVQDVEPGVQKLALESMRYAFVVSDFLCFLSTIYVNVVLYPSSLRLMCFLSIRFDVLLAQDLRTYFLYMSLLLFIMSYCVLFLWHVKTW